MKPGTFSQIYLQIIFAVKGRHSLIKPNWETDLYKYITGIVQGKEQKMLAINGTENHIHFLIGLKPSCKISDLVREVKKSSNTYVKENKFTKFKFEWQEGYGVFSYSHSSLDNVISYINNQKEHHRKRTFKEEYLEFLNKFDVGYDDRYLFDLNDIDE